MRWLHVGFAAAVGAVLIVGGTAHAEPIAPPPPAAGFFGQPLDLPGLIDRLIPPPPIPPTSGPIPPIAAAPGESPSLAAMRLAMMPEPTDDSFFDDWPIDLARYHHGRIIDRRDVTAAATPLLIAPVRQVTQLKFRTTDGHGRASYATTTLAVPATDWRGGGDRPVLVNNIAIDSLGRKCNPGYPLAHGFSIYSDFTDYLLPTTQLALLRGYAVLFTDYEGPRMAYADPFVEGHAVLDSIRAVRNWRSEEFGHSRFALTGYSGGAIANDAAVKLMSSYTPELSGVIVGAASGGVPNDYAMLAHTMNGNLASGVLAAATFGIGRERPEILAKMNHLAQWIAVSPLKDQCFGVYAAGGVLQLPIDVFANVEHPLDSALAGRIYRQTLMANRKSGAPLLIYHGAKDFWVPPEGARELYREQCRLGVTATYRSVLGEHFLGSMTAWPIAAMWLDARLRGVPAPNECPASQEPRNPAGR